MGLLDTGYSTVNGKKPRKSDRQIPGQEMNVRGLLDAATNIPIAGDVLSGGLAAYDAAKGDYGSAALNALGVLPFVSGTFIGKGAKTWDAVKAADAEKRIAAGDDVRKVWKETGTFKGPDGHLRQEIDDSSASMKIQGHIPWYGRQDMAMEHKPLYEAYPDSAHIKRSNDSGISNTGYFKEPDKIVLATNLPDAKSSNIHELQHAIQQREGWARGGSTEAFAEDAKTLQAYHDAMTRSQYGLIEAKSAGGIHPETGLSAKTYSENMNALAAKIDGLNKSGAALDPYDAYRRLAGEAEARATQARMNMNMEQRLNTYPLDSYDVPVDQLIMRGQSNGPAMSTTVNAGNPTKYELAHETARKNAVEMLGLPENNTAMDRAKAMGFDTPAYRGTVSDEKTARMSKGAMGDAYYSGLHPETGNSYAGDAKGANVIPLLIRGPLASNAEMSSIVRESGWNGLSDALASKGYSGVADRMFEDAAAVKDLSSVRSRFAAFDPAKKNKADIMGYADPYLLSAIGGGGLLGLAGYKASQE